MFKKYAVLLGILLTIVPSIALAQSPFDPLVKNLEKLGVFNILIFIFFGIVLFSILVKTKLLGENLVINAVIAIIVAFFIFIYPTFTGFNLVEPLSRFFTQMSVLILLLAAAFIAASLFYPNITKVLTEQFKSPTIVYIMIFVVIVFLIISRVVWVLWAGFGVGGNDLIILVAAILIFVALLFVAAAAGGGGK
jgi:hypothetical protein